MLRRLTRADQLCAAGAVITVLASFLTWFSWNTATSAVSVNGFRAGVFGDVAYLAAMLMLLLVALRVRVLTLGGRSPQIPDPPARLVLGGIAAAAMVVQSVVGSGGSHGFGPGVLAGLVGAGVMVYGAVRRRHEDEQPATT